MTVLTEVLGSPLVQRHVLAKQIGTCPQTLDGRLRDLKEFNEKTHRYGSNPVIKDGGLVLINYIAFMDFTANREKIKNGIPIPEYEPRKLAWEIGWY